MPWQHFRGYRNVVTGKLHKARVRGFCLLLVRKGVLKWEIQDVVADGNRLLFAEVVFMGLLCD